MNSERNNLTIHDKIFKKIHDNTYTIDINTFSGYEVVTFLNHIDDDLEILLNEHHDADNIRRVLILRLKNINWKIDYKTNSTILKMFIDKKTDISNLVEYDLIGLLSYNDNDLMGLFVDINDIVDIRKMLVKKLEDISGWKI